MFRVLHLIDHNGLGGAQRLLRGILIHRPQDMVLPLRLKTPALFPASDFLSQAGWRHTYLNYFSVLPQVYRLIQAGSVDILHCHLQASFTVGLMLRRICAKKNIALIFHEHNPYMAHHAVYRRLVRAAGGAGLMLAVSPQTQGALISCGLPEERVVLLPNFIDVDQLRLSEKPSISMSQKQAGKWTVGFAGRLVVEKGWRYALEAIARLSSFPIELRIAGEGKEMAQAKRWVAERGLESRVRFLGVVTDMAAFYRSLDVLLHPAIEEPFGLSPLEAQACGVPVVAFCFAGSDFIFGTDSALLCPIGDVECLAEMLRQILMDISLREALIEKGKQNVQRFHPITFFDSLNEIYQLACGGNISENEKITPRSGAL
ncbi:MAG: glycosyltransferase [Chloroflexota bacterium]